MQAANILYARLGRYRSYRQPRKTHLKRDHTLDTDRHFRVEKSFYLIGLEAVYN